MRERGDTSPACERCAYAKTKVVHAPSGAAVMLCTSGLVLQGCPNGPTGPWAALVARADMCRGQHFQELA